MNRWWLLPLGILLSASANKTPTSYYIEVPYNSHADLKRLVEKGYDIGGVDLERKRISIVAHDSELKTLRAERILEKRPIDLAPDPLFKKPEQVIQALKDTEMAFPNLAAVEIIGKTTEGRDIHAIRLTSQFVVNPTGRKPVLMIDAMHHAREIMTPEVALDMVEYLTKNYATDAQVKNWMDNVEVWIVPQVNPDGNHRVWTNNAMWRKNTRNNHGVDINRNYDYDWGKCDGSSGSTSSDIYRGSAPASEPETQALMQLANRIKPKYAISYHSYSEIVIYPFGCDPKRIPEEDRAAYEGLGKELASKLVRDSGSGTYEPGTAYELLYNVDGGSIDWMYDANKTFAFVIEVNSGSQGFQPSYSKWRDTTVKRNREGWMLLLNKLVGK